MQTRSYPQHTVIGDRFELESVAGSGGMGTVYQARDGQTGRVVAIKILHPQLAQAPRSAEFTRFMREAQVLSALNHPGIVSYIANGETGDGLPFLAMEWLSGEDLAARLQRSPLAVAEAVALLAAVADALAAAHAQGVVHRDIKPSNLFLRGGLFERVAVLDFGVAQWINRAVGTTRTGMVIGTPEYMAPEQARGQRVIRPAADIFALGSVVYHCLTGISPFKGDHVVASLSGVLFDEPPPLRSLRPEVPRGVEELVRQMLNKDPSGRPQDASALVLRIRELQLAGHLRGAYEPDGGEPSGAIIQGALPLGNEQSLVTAILAQDAGDPKAAEPVAVTPAAIEAAPTPAGATGSLRAGSVEGSLSGTLQNRLRSFGVHVEQLADGTIAALLSAVGSPREQVARACRCALLIADEMPGARIAIATARDQLRRVGVLSGGQAVGHALQLLSRYEQKSPLTAPGAGSAVGACTILLDSVSVAFLPRQFTTLRMEDHALLLGEEGEQDVEELRLVLGRPTQCVGREQELALLDSLLGVSLDEPMARASLLIAPAGLGKSRIRYEFLRRVQDQHPEAELLFGRGDPIRTASPYGLLAQLLRHVCDLHGHPDIERQQQQMEERFGRHLPAALRAPTLLVLGELCGIPFADHAPPQRPAAPADDAAWGRQVAQCVSDFLAAECAHHPVILVLEDLHWSDGQSLRVIDFVLRNLSEMPLFVLGLARPEIDQLFPDLWTGRVQELRLTGLGKRASERLVRQILGPSTADATITRVVEQAAGNALFIEELARAVAEGKGDEPPATVLAMLQSRLLRMDAGARRILRAASIFGLTFWRQGLLWLCGLRHAPPDQQAAIDTGLRYLLEAEIIERHRKSRFPEDQQYGFRHVLMRDAAYALLTEDDRKLGHGLAGLFLEQAGERDQALLAGHTHRIVQYLQQRHSSLMVSRLMMLTGLRLRAFTANTPDDPAVLQRLRAALSHLVQGEELAELQSLFRDR